MRKPRPRRVKSFAWGPTAISGRTRLKTRWIWPWSCRSSCFAKMQFVLTVVKTELQSRIDPFLWLSTTVTCVCLFPSLPSTRAVPGMMKSSKEGRQGPQPPTDYSSAWWLSSVSCFQVHITPWTKLLEGRASILIVFISQSPRCLHWALINLLWLRRGQKACFEVVSGDQVGELQPGFMGVGIPSWGEQQSEHTESEKKVVWRVQWQLSSGKVQGAFRWGRRLQRKIGGRP